MNIQKFVFFCKRRYLVRVLKPEVRNPFFYRIFISVFLYVFIFLIFLCLLLIQPIVKSQSQYVYFTRENTQSKIITILLNDLLLRALRLRPKTTSFNPAVWCFFSGELLKVNTCENSARRRRWANGRLPQPGTRSLLSSNYVPHTQFCNLSYNN